MTEVVQQVRTVFTAESGGLQRELAAIKTASQQASREVDQFQKQASSYREVRIQSGSTNSAGANAFTRAQFGYRAGERMATDDMLAELERIRLRAKEAKTPVSELGEAIKAAGAKTDSTSAKVGNFRDKVKDAVGPIDNFRGGISMLRENIGMFALGIPSAIAGLVELIALIDSAPSPESVEWGKTFQHLGQDYRDFQKFVQEQEVRRGNITPDSPEAKAIKDARALIVGGDPDPKDDSGQSNAGFWQRAAENEAAAIAYYYKTVHQARLDGYRVDAAGNLSINREMLSPSERYTINRAGGLDAKGLDSKGIIFSLREQSMLAGDLRRQFDAMTSASAERTKVEQQNAKLMWDQTVAAVDLLGKLQNIKNVGAIVLKGVGDTISDLSSSIAQGVARNFASLKTDKEKQEDFGKGLAKLIGVDLKHGKTGVNADFRGSKITLNTKLETDDPARFADASLKALFLGASARALTGVMAMGSPGLANGSR